MGQRKAREFLEEQNATLYHPKGISLNYHRLCVDPESEITSCCCNSCSCGRNYSIFYFLTITPYDAASRKPIFSPALVDEWEQYQGAATGQFLCCKTYVKP